MTTLRAKVARDINCLRDADKSKRRGGIRSLKRALLTSDDTLTPGAEAIFAEELCPLLLSTLEDVTDSVRENSSLLLSAYIREHTSDNNFVPHVVTLLTILKRRIGQLPLLETSEEIRLAFLTLLQHVVHLPTSRSVLVSHMDTVVDIVAASSTDPFPESKLKCAELTLDMCKYMHEHIHKCGERLIAAQIENFAHQRSAVRVAALQASTETICLAGNTIEVLLKDGVIPKYEMLLFDRTASVRKQLSIAVCKILANATHSISIKCSIPFLYILLTLEASEMTGISETTVDTFHNLASKIQQNLQDSYTEAAKVDFTQDLQVAAKSASETSNLRASSSVPSPETQLESIYHELELPVPFDQHMPPSIAAHVIRMNAFQLLQQISSNLNEWTVNLRLAAAGAFRSFVVYTGPQTSDFAAQVINLLCDCMGDDDASVRQLLHDTSILVGAFVPIEVQLSIVLPALNDVSRSAQRRYFSLCVLHDMIQGMDTDEAKPHANAIAEALVKSDLAYGEEVNTSPIMMAHTVSAFVDLVEPNDAHSDIVQAVVLACVKLLRTGGSNDVRQVAIDSLQQLCNTLQLDSQDKLLSICADNLLQMLMSTLGTWTRYHPDRQVFDGILRAYPNAFSNHVPKIMRIFKETVKPSQDADLRISMLALFDAMLLAIQNDEAQTSHENVTQTNQEHNLTLENQDIFILREFLIPNLVWRAGGVASAIRKVASTCLHTLVKNRVAKFDNILTVWNELQSVLISNLADNDAITRQITCLTLQNIFELSHHNLLDHQTCRTLYPELLKRLDDSSDVVRQCSILAITKFPQAAPKDALQGGPTEFTIDALLIHMDDPDETIQNACFSALVEYAQLDVQYVLQKTIAARSRHRSAVLCDQLIARIETNDTNHS